MSRCSPRRSAAPRDRRGAAPVREPRRARPGAPPDFLALDRLLELAGAAGAGGPAGYVIAQLLGQTS